LRLSPDGRGLPPATPDDLALDPALARALGPDPNAAEQFRSIARRQWQIQAAARAKDTNDELMRDMATYEAMPRRTGAEVAASTAFLRNVLAGMQERERLATAELAQWRAGFDGADVEIGRHLALVATAIRDLKAALAANGGIQAGQDANDAKAFNRATKTLQENASWAFHPDPDDPIVQGVEARRAETDAAIDAVLGRPTIVIKPR